ncbi:hypothetical protein [Thiothrix lacustris]|uniref:hypothetical protein n=1 Tax=Thiothrix lacustris TaxID=525917 RepID=UPI000AFED989|nr:hypothetical protein [Thiothrix lacustris]
MIWRKFTTYLPMDNRERLGVTGLRYDLEHLAPHNIAGMGFSRQERERYQTCLLANIG